jgi:hypothetical protein
MEELGKEEQTPSECYTVNFDLRQPAVSRSSIAPDESRINDFNIYVYERGVLANSLYMEDCTDVAVVLNAGMTYNIYIGKRRPCRTIPERGRLYGKLHLFHNWSVRDRGVSAFCRIVEGCVCGQIRAAFLYNLGEVGFKGGFQCG